METANRHYAVIDPVRRRITVKYRGETILESEDGLILKEVGKSVYDPVFYFPKQDLLVDLLPEDSRSSHCPIKGDAKYWNLDQATDNYFAWSYEEPLPMSSKIKGHIAFNPEYVTFVSAPI